MKPIRWTVVVNIKGHTNQPTVIPSFIDAGKSLSCSCTALCRLYFQACTSGHTPISDVKTIKSWLKTPACIISYYVGTLVYWMGCIWGCYYTNFCAKFRWSSKAETTQQISVPLATLLNNRLHLLRKQTGARWRGWWVFINLGSLLHTCLILEMEGMAFWRVRKPWGRYDFPPLC